MSIEDLRRLQQRRPQLVLGKDRFGNDCDHKGYIVPMVFLPQTMETPGDKPGDPPKKTEFFVVQTARCINCPATFTFGMAPPSAPPAPEAGPEVPAP